MYKPDEDIEIELVMSDATEPPSRKDATVESLCTICLSDIVDLFNKLPKWKNTEGQEYRRFQYEIRMMSDGASLDFAIYHKNRRLESRNVSIGFSNGKTI